MLGDRYHPHRRELVVEVSAGALDHGIAVVRAVLGCLSALDHAKHFGFATPYTERGERIGRAERDRRAGHSRVVTYLGFDGFAPASKAQRLGQSEVRERHADDGPLGIDEFPVNRCLIEASECAPSSIESKTHVPMIALEDRVRGRSEEALEVGLALPEREECERREVVSTGKQHSVSHAHGKQTLRVHETVDAPKRGGAQEPRSDLEERRADEVIAKQFHGAAYLSRRLSLVTSGDSRTFSLAAPAESRGGVIPYS